MNFPKEYASPRPTAFPSENGARAVLLMEHVWPELAEFVEINLLAERYHFDYLTLEVAARELYQLGLFERTEKKLVRHLFFLFPFQVTVYLYRRKSA